MLQSSTGRPSQSPPAQTKSGKPSPVSRRRLSKKSRPADMSGWTGHIQGNLALRVCEPPCGECAVQRQILSPGGYQGEGISVPRMRAEMGSPWSVALLRHAERETVSGFPPGRRCPFVQKSRLTGSRSGRPEGRDLSDRSAAGPHLRVRHFLGQAAAHRPQPTQAAASSCQVLAARSTVMALWGHFRAQRVQ